MRKILSLIKSGDMFHWLVTFIKCMFMQRFEFPNKEKWKSCFATVKLEIRSNVARPPYTYFSFVMK